MVKETAKPLLSVPSADPEDHRTLAMISQCK